jgi:hypothetical protein
MIVEDAAMALARQGWDGLIQVNVPVTPVLVWWAGERDGS